MHHNKPALHEGTGDRVSGQNSGLSNSLTLRMPQWMRDMLDTVAEDGARYNDGSATPLAIDATDAGSIAREFIAAGLLKHWLKGYYNEPQITAGDDIDDDISLPGSVHTALDAQLTIRMPRWMRVDIDDVSGEQSGDLADSSTASARELIVTGYLLYESRSLPFGEPVQSGAKLRCPNCAEDGVFALWQRTFEFDGYLADLFDDLDAERENPYRAFIKHSYKNFGWWAADEELDDRSHPLHGLSHVDRDHPDVQNLVTVCHCHLCGHTDERTEFQRMWYRDH